MKRLFLSATIVVALFASNVAAAAPNVPQCSGNDLERAARARNDGLAHYRASKHEGAGDVEMATALQSFNDACAAGDDTALELRAYALAALNKYVDAAQSLDAFLAAHPLDALAPEARARVVSQQAEILTHVASLDVDSTPPGVQVSIDHFAVGLTPLRGARLAPGSYEIEVAQDDGTSQARKVDLALGTHKESFDFSQPTLIETATPPPPPQANRDTQPHTSLRPWAYGTAIGAGALAVVGVVGLVYANGRANTYNDYRGADANGNTAYCSSVPTPDACSGLKSQYGAGLTLGVVGFVGAGVLAATSATLFYLDIRGRNANSANRGSSHFMAVSCAPWFGAGASCVGAF